MSDSSDTQSRALNALGGQVLEEGSLDDVLRHVCKVTIDIVGDADEASVSLLEGGEPRTYGATGDLAVTADQCQYDAGAGPCLDAARASQVLLVSDLAGENRWEAASEMARHGAKSSLSLPLPVQGESIGALNLYAREAGAFDDSILDLGEKLASYAAVAVLNAVSYSSAAEAARNLRQAMEHRSTIEQAKGIIMATTGCDADAAFDVLVRQSQHENRKLREVADELVARSIRR
jgi:GAF domain-containing protein